MMRVQMHCKIIRGGGLHPGGRRFKPVTAQEELLLAQADPPRLRSQNERTERLCRGRSEPRMSELPRETLFLRVPPPGLLSRAATLRGGRLSSVFRADGSSGYLGGRRITCFWIGFGRGVRAPGPGLLERLRDGSIEDVLDVGCAGALDPSLRRGDLVLSSDDLPFDAGAPLEVQRRPAAREIARLAAESRNAALHVAPVLTHERAILAREERLRLFEQTGCAAVQMEHAWFLELLQSLLPETAFRRLRVTHLVLITDAVPRQDGGWERARAAWDAISGYALPGRGGIVSLRREFLRRWLST